MKEHQERTGAEAAFWNAKAARPRRLLFRRNWYRQANRRQWWHVFRALGEVGGRSVLFVGCGESGSIAAALASRGAELWCLDISTRSLDRLMQHPFGDERNRVHPVAGDAEAMPFPAGQFDIVFGKAIVHHLDVARFMAEVVRVCVPGGQFVFCEPLGTNPAIGLFRLLTPSLRVPTEHPLWPADLRAIAGCCRQLEVRYCDFLTALSFPLYFAGLLGAGRFAHRVLEGVEAALFGAVPPLGLLAWSVILAGQLRGRSTETKGTGR